MTAPASSTRIEAVQVLRALAALLVVVTHAINANDYRLDMPRSWLGSAGHFNEFGAIGVDLFFVISGFIMAHTVTHRPKLGARAFLTMRFIRVVPPFWLASLVFLPMALLCGRSFTASQFVDNVTIFPLTTASAYQMPVLSLGWTLAFELAFYGVVTLAIAAAPQGRRLTVTMQMVGLLALAGIYASPQWSVTALLINPIWFEFLAGLAIYWLWQRHPASARPIVALILVLSLGGLAHSLVFGASFTDHPRTLFWPDPALQADQRTGLARAIGWGLPSAGLLLAILWLVQGKAGRHLASSSAWHGMLKLGDASYSLYLVHPLVITPWQYLAPTNSLNPDLMIAILVALSCALALLAHRHVEAPLLGVCRSLIGGRPRLVLSGT